MKSTIISLIGIAMLLLLSNCENEKPLQNQSEITENDSLSVNSNNYRRAEERNEKLNIKVAPNQNLLLIDNSGQIIQYDDEADYSELQNFTQIWFAKLARISLQNYYIQVLQKDILIENENGYKVNYSKDFIDHFNSKVNLVYELPLQTGDEELDEFFNKIYYDYRDNEIYEQNRGYGYQKFTVFENGKRVGSLTFMRSKNNKDLEIK